MTEHGTNQGYGPISRDFASVVMGSRRTTYPPFVGLDRPARRRGRVFARVSNRIFPSVEAVWRAQASAHTRARQAPDRPSTIRFCRAISSIPATSRAGGKFHRSRAASNSRLYLTSPNWWGCKQLGLRKFRAREIPGPPRCVAAPRMTMHVRARQLICEIFR